MRNIVKAQPPQSLEKWKALANENWTPRYSDFQNPEKRETHRLLLEEQGWTCCYCGCFVDLDTSHLEHFYPQERYGDQELDYENIFVSCIRDISPQLPLHCGHAKSSQLDENLCISPLDEDCTRRFIFGLNGKIAPVMPNDLGAHYMLDILKLDIPYLQNRRASALAGIFDQHFLETVSNEELMLLREDYLLRDAEGRHQEFFHMVARFIDGLLPTGI